jgi:excinuclease UvrABC helicase subunit UvrB
MDAPDSRPLLINQLAIEQSISEAFREGFRERQRQRGFRLVTDITSEEAERAREESPILAETQPQPESQTEKQLDVESDEEVIELIEKVKRADPNSE